MKYGLHVVESPARLRHSSRRQGDGSTRRWTSEKGVDMKTVLITGCSSGYGLETARHFHAQGWNVIATMRTPREDILPRSDATTRPGARRDEAREHRRRDRGVRAHRRARQQRGHRGRRRLRGHADGDGARGVRDQHLRRDGDDAGGAASASRAEVGRGGECDLERDADADAAGGRVHREQDGYRRVHRIARARARGVQRAGQTG